MKKSVRKRITVTGRILILLAFFLLAGSFPLSAHAWGYEEEFESTGISIFDDYIRDPDHARGAEWPLSQRPKISGSAGGSGCASYTSDFIKYCYNKGSYSGSTTFTDPDEIRAGDVIHLTSPGSGHWFAVLKRDGDYLYTAEGNWGSVVRIGWNYMISEGDVLGSRHTFDKGYHFLPETLTGTWLHDAGGWRYKYWDNAYAVGSWIRDNSVWYYLGEECYMVTGWQYIDDHWYYFGGSGAMQTGWKRLDGTWYYFGNNGIMVNKWKKINEKWYYFVGGAMQTGWKKLGGNWYFFQGGGSMTTGWKKISGKWYYFEESGIMVTGTREIDGVEYSFDSSGAMME